MTLFLKGQRLLLTGGCGFIGSNLIRELLLNQQAEVINVDKLGYASCPGSLADVEHLAGYQFQRVDLLDRPALDQVLKTYRPDGVIHLAAESHVDRSIDGPEAFVQSNIVGTFHLLEAALAYWRREGYPQSFRFHHVSTDEVFGTLGDHGLFTENTAYAPNSPYSATKASSDHLVRAWHHTYGLPVVISNCSNNYGPFQFPEKLIPLVITNALESRSLPIYGDGLNVRDWLYVEDHAKALCIVYARGENGEQYNIGGHNECTNIELVKQICALLDEICPRSSGESYAALIQMVRDRAGHDRRYAIDASKIQRTLGWGPVETLETGLRKTVEWYLNNEIWVSSVRSKGYAGERLGLSGALSS